MVVNLPAVTGSRCQATASYIPVHDDEIVLNVGDCVRVLYVYDDGWILGKNKTTGDIGLLPGNFLETILDNSKEQLDSLSSVRYAEKRQSSLVKTLGSLGAMLSSTAIGDSSPNSSLPVIEGRQLGFESEECLVDDYARKGSYTHHSDWKGGSDEVLGANCAIGIKAPIPIQATSPNSKEASIKKLQENLHINKSIHTPSSIGTIRAIVAGDSGIGRTSFIYSFLTCPRIFECTKPNDIEINSRSSGVARLTEVRASTISSKNQHEAVERFNLSFIEPVGMGVSPDTMRIITSVADFHVWQFQTTDKVFVRDRSIPKSTLIRFLNSGTGAHSHIDVCIYGVLHRLKVTDLKFIKQISPYTVLVPVILKSDTMTPSEIFGLKLSIIEEFKNCGVSCYGFGFSNEELIQFAKDGVYGAPPFAVCSTSAARSLVSSSKYPDHITEFLESYTYDENGVQARGPPQNSSYDTTKMGEHPAQQQGLPTGCYNSETDRINELDILRDSLLMYYIGDIRQITAEKFVKWRASTLEQ